MADHKNEKDDVTGIDTTGHEWDGIKELNTPLPRWWLWTFYATIVWGLIYTILYPAWPLLNSATQGVLGASTRAEVAQEIAEFEERNADVIAELASADLTEVEPGTPVHDYAIAGGAAVFRSHCSQCHGSGAAGAPGGYPNLLDDAWLWGGSVEDIAYTVRHGIRNETDRDARWSQMPAYGEIFSQEEIVATANYVLSLSTTPPDASNLELGETLFAENCAACHGENAMGDTFQGAPNLTDAIWLYGGDIDTVIETITYSRFGVMPAWGPRLTDAEVNAVALYVHQLGGGE
jgi:cytochrome c oxidase cbb3-type subunit 3